MGELIACSNCREVAQSPLFFIKATETLFMHLRSYLAILMGDLNEFIIF
jgi:hypothetical protein